MGLLEGDPAAKTLAKCKQIEFLGTFNLIIIQSVRYKDLFAFCE